eukprot:8749171-Lingulodinium_polyedra.AAC.1
MMRSNRPSAAATARESHASHTPCEHQFLVFAWRAQRVQFASRCNNGVRFSTHSWAAFARTLLRNKFKKAFGCCGAT